MSRSESEEKAETVCSAAIVYLWSVKGFEVENEVDNSSLSIECALGLSNKELYVF